MKSFRTVCTAALMLLLASGLGACSNMSARERATATGAAVGGVAGAVVTGGSTAGVVGGAVVGGVIANELDKKKNK